MNSITATPPLQKHAATASSTPCYGIARLHQSYWLREDDPPTTLSAIFAGVDAPAAVQYVRPDGLTRYAVHPWLQTRLSFPVWRRPDVPLPCSLDCLPEPRWRDHGFGMKHWQTCYHLRPEMPPFPRVLDAVGIPSWVGGEDGGNCWPPATCYVCQVPTEPRSFCSFLCYLESLDWKYPYRHIFQTDANCGLSPQMFGRYGSATGIVSVLVGGELVRRHDARWELIPKTSEDFDKSRRGWRAVLPAETGTPCRPRTGARKSPTRDMSGNRRASRATLRAVSRNGD